MTKPITALRLLKVGDIMHKDVITIEGSAPVAEAIRIMQEKHISSLVVKRRNEDDAYGIVTERDILSKVIDPGPNVSLDIWNIQVHEIMTKPAISVYPEMRLKYCLRLMRRSRIRRVLILEGQQLAGILTESDVLERINTERPEEEVAL